MTKYLIAFLSLFITLAIQAQENELLKGKITNEALGEISINIINLTQKTGTTNTLNGSFQIEVTENDTLLFSSIQYDKLKVNISKEILEKGFLEVYLDPNVNELAEVNINNYGLTGSLSQDTKNIKTYTATGFGLPVSKKPPLTQTERRIYSATHSNGIIPVDYLISAISGRLKYLKQIKANEDLRVLVDTTIATFPPEFFTDYLHIIENLRYSFVYYCAEKHNLKYVIKTGNELDLIQYFEKIAIEFLKLQEQK